MSKNFELLEIEKCISSRLWYTSFAVLRTEIDSHYLANYTRDDVDRIHELIKNTAAVHDGELFHQWISYKLLLLLDKRNSADTKDILDLILYSHKLSLISVEVPDSVKKELLHLFTTIVNAKKNDSYSDTISITSVKSLEKGFCLQPALTTELMNDLLHAWPATSFLSNWAIQDELSNILKLLTRKESIDENFCAVLCILSKLNLTESKEDDLMNWLNEHLFDTCDPDFVELAFYSRSDEKCLKEWHIFLDEKYFRSVSLDSDGVAEKLYDVIIPSHGDTPNQPCFYPKELSLRVIKRKVHWLQDLLDIFYTLTKKEEHDKIKKLLLHPVLRNLWPTLLLHYLHKLPHIRINAGAEYLQKSISIHRSLEFMLRTCYSIQCELNQPILSHLHSHLSCQIRIVEWILEFSKKYPLFVSDPNLSVKRILNEAQDCCILTILKKSIDIHECDHSEIEKLLEDSKDAISIFRSYRAMQKTLRTILRREIVDTQSASLPNEDYCKLESLINEITPLLLRIEVIENIFSMLFLRYDLHFDSIIEGTSEEEGYETTLSEKGKHSSAYESKESEGTKRYGFINDEQSVKNLLLHLKRCMVQVGIDFAKLRRESENTNDLEQIQKSIFSIDKVLNDAIWRRELLTGDNHNQNQKNIEENLASLSHTTTDDKLNFSFRQMRKAIFYDQRAGSSSSDCDQKPKLETDVSSETSSTDVNSVNNKRKKRRNTKHNAGSLANSSTARNNNSKFIINLMLASKESLVYQCLWKSDYTKAHQVIEMFNLKNSPLDAQVQFSEAMQNFRREVRKQMNPVDALESPKKNEKLQILENVRRAALGGYNNSRVANSLETFIASQESFLRSSGLAEDEAREQLCLGALDLALTLSARNMSPSSSTSLLEVAAKHSDRVLKNPQFKRHLEHLDHVSKIVNEVNLSASEALLNARLSLRSTERSERNELWGELAELLSRFRDSQSLLSLDKDDEGTKGEVVKELAGQASLLEMAKLIGEHGNAFLYKLLAHLQLISSVAPADEKMENRIESFLLCNSIDSYLGHRIFDLNVAPEDLEVTANKLGVNLVHNILINCCPKLTCYDTLRSQPSDTWGCIVLNKQSNEPVDLGIEIGDPNQCVADILLELLQTTKRFYPDCSRISNKDLADLSKENEVQSILAKSSVLEHLDLSELSVGEHTLAFFLNLWNLLFLHALLNVWMNDPPVNSLKNTVSLSAISYCVGDLGRISLATLRSKLLGNISWNSEFFSQSEDLNEVAWQDLDLTHDPRVIFAMMNEYFETPAVKVYYPQTLNKDLNQSVHDYLKCYKKVSESIILSSDDSQETKLIVRYPDFIELYEKSIFKSAEHSSVNLNQSNQNISLETDFFEKSAKVIHKYEPVTSAYDILIKYEHLNSTKLSASLRRSISSSYHVPSSTSWTTRPMKPDVLHYLEGHCWLLSYLVKRIHKGSSSMTESGCDDFQRISCLENNCSSPWITTLATSLFNDNPILASLQENLSLNDFWCYLEKSVKGNRIRECLDIINSLPTKLLMKYTEMQCLRDKLLCQLIHAIDLDSNASEIMQYLYQIKDIGVLAQTILSNIKRWPVNVCQDALHHVLQHDDKDKLPAHCRFRLNEKLCRVTVFHKMLPYCKNEELSTREPTWYDVVYCTEKTDPISIIQSLIDADKFELCLEWLEYQAFSFEIQTLVTLDLLLGLLKNDESDFKSARKLLSALPIKQSMKMCKGVLKRLESIGAMKFAIEFLLEHCEPKKSVTYHKIHLGVNILEQLEPRERIHHIQLLKEPLLMLEQLLMNCKFECLRKIVDVIQRSDDIQKSGLLIEDFDKVVRFYAGKSLDFRVSLQRDGLDSKSRDSAASASSDNDSRCGEFIMPVNVPTREEWVPNEKARECSCCQTVIFSMFNRRHHCRRCGRVVCAGCSQQRMQVLGYPESVLVRVCDDCKKQTVLQSQAAQGAPSVASSIVLECWKLTKDEVHNQTVRDEFSFEYAPNISLCLAILNLHSDHQAYASFLLDRCDEMKRLLHPGPGGRVNPEVDHALIIKMIRSLLVAAKVKCAKLGLNAGLAHCDRFLSQVDLISTLVQSDCLALIPTDDSLDEHALRKLRDLLTEKEQWTLALDVSTKSGLDTQGVWAAWGKACLKAGYLDRARSKFSHCLEKVLFENFDDWVLVSYPEGENSAKTNEDSLEIQRVRKIDDSKVFDSPSRKRQALKGRPIKNPPLLVEILQILENQNQLNLDPTTNSPQSKTNVAQEILSTLSSLKAISQGQCSLVNEWNSRNVYYEESLYYLLTYGSSSSILEFYLLHDEYKKSLAFVQDNNVDPDLFFNSVYLRCLNMGNAEKLLASMKADDASLLAWKKYLVYTCHCLDKKRFLHSLYHLQLFMKDFIRASMTCIRFYQNDARDYVDLCAKAHYLVDAQKHLETELNVENLSRKRRKSVSSFQSGSLGGLTMEMEASEIDKHINTISRQLEIAKFLGNAEKEGRLVTPYLTHLLDMDSENSHSDELPTLFGNQQQKARLAVLAILCGRDTEEGFGIAFRIIQDYNLRPQKVYSLAGHILALEKKFNSIEQLIKCCRSSGSPDSLAISDRVLTHCVKLLLHNFETESISDMKDRIDSLIRMINDVELKISSYIESKQLKAAYLLAVKHQRAQDIRKILNEADRLGQNAIRSICTKWLQQTQNLM